MARYDELREVRGNYGYECSRQSKFFRYERPVDRARYILINLP